MRTNAREEAYKLIFEYLFYKELNEHSLEILSSGELIDDDDRGYISTIYRGVVEKFEELYSLIEATAVDFKAQRIYKTDLAAIILALYEIKFMSDIPEKVSINEALNLVKKYSTDKSGVFVNGILKSFI